MHRFNNDYNTWRKPLIHFNFSKIAKTLFSTTLVISGTFAFSQKAPTMPSVPNVVMPTVGSFYTPSTNGFYSGNRSSNTRTNANVQIKSQNSNRVMTDEINNDLIKELNKNFSAPVSSSNSNKESKNLTANDISNLNSLGLFESLTGVIKKDANSDSKNLEKILTELKEIKSNTNQNEKKVSFESEDIHESKILRFSVNNDDCLKTIKSVFFSKEEKDGTFLLTGDCKYSKDGKAMSETFYMLFQSAGVESGISRYKVSITDSKNSDTETFLSKLSNFSENQELFATRTGNLMTMRINESDLRFDLLLALDN